MKRALVLSGGGSMGAFEAGAVEYLVLQEKLDFQIFLGTSAGALNVALLGQAASYEELCTETVNLKNLWLSIKNNSAIYTPSGIGYLPLLFQNHLYLPKGLEALLEQYVDVNRLCNNPDRRVVKVVTVAEETGELLYADSRRPELREDYRKYILASASMPVYFPPVPVNGKHWYDGGLRDISPLGTVFDEAPDEIVIVTTYPLTEDFSPVIPVAAFSNSSFQIIIRTVAILTAEIGANDIQIADLINQAATHLEGKRRVPLTLISPATPLPEANVLDFNAATIAERIRLGYAAAQNPRFLPLKNRDSSF